MCKTNWKFSQDIGNAGSGSHVPDISATASFNDWMILSQTTAYG